uniref:Uncharacterized protein n=1 Tax=Ditylenchus dipsaci TaxID=166011 RepID=A0A915E2D2_9BILA
MIQRQFSIIQAIQICPSNAAGTELVCAVHCCESEQGSSQGYFCCGVEDNKGVDSKHSRAERFATYQGAFQVDYTLLLIGLLVSIVVSVLLSFLCCLLCNGCWLHRRRNPERYESVQDSGFYPICCGFGIPLGTVVFSTHPPQFNNDGVYGSSTTSLPSSRNRVRFNQDGTPIPKGVLKNGGGNEPHFT